MPYYRGDYYRGDYYRGDPFLGALAGLAGRAVGKLAKKAVGWVGRQATSRVGRMGVPILRDAASSTVAGAVGYTMGRREAEGYSEIGQIPRLGSGGGAPKRYRRMNPLNPKALRRALRRAEGFEKFARKTVSGLRYGAKKFKSQRRAS